MHRSFYTVLLYSVLNVLQLQLLGPPNTPHLESREARQKLASGYATTIPSEYVLLQECTHA